MSRAGIAAIVALASAVSLGAAPPALAQDNDSKSGQCSLLRDWVDHEPGAVRVNAEIDGGVSNSVSALIKTSPEGETLASFIGGPHVGLPAHSYVQTDWAYVAPGQQVYVIVAGGAAGPAPNGGCNDALSSGYWTTG